MRELTAIVRELKDPRVHKSMLSIVRTDTSGDLSYCKVYVSAMAGLPAAKEAVEGLKSASGFIRHALGERLSMRKCPELRFVADDSIAKSAEINKMLEDMEK